MKWTNHQSPHHNTSDTAHDIEQTGIKFFPTSQKEHAVTLVAHGLNNKPSIMLPIIEWLRAQGSDVFMVKFFGHHKETAPMKEMEKDSWYQEFRMAYCQAKARARELNVPIHFLGYSLGALVGQYAITIHEGKISFDKQVLWAPATATRLPSFFFQVLSLLPGKWHLPSFTPIAYRFNKWLPIKAYRYLYQMKKEVRKSNFNYLHIPTLIIVDPKDEVIDLERLKKDKLNYQLDRYRFLELNAEEAITNTPYHHLMVDERTVGKKNWRNMLSKMAHFFYSVPQNA
jgi:esterase/lipase